MIKLVEIAFPKELSHVKAIGGKDLKIINTNYTGSSEETVIIQLKDIKV